MAKFVNTRKAVSEIEDLIKNAEERLILISPYLRLSSDFRELLQYRNNKDKITTVIFGKQELKPEEMKFLKSLRFVVLNFNENLHAKCYVNDDTMIITSLNLYAFSMANNKEMGVLIRRDDPADRELFEDAMKEVDFIKETSQRFDFAAAEPAPSPTGPKSTAPTTAPRKYKRLTSSKLARKLGIKTPELLDRLVSRGLLSVEGGDHVLTDAGRKVGEMREKGRFGPYFLWDADLTL